MRHDLNAPEGRRQRHANHSGRRCIALADARFHLIHVLHDHERAFIEALARIGQAESARGPARQLRAEAGFETGDQLAHGRLADAGGARRLGKVARIRDPYEQAHDIDAIHE